MSSRPLHVMIVDDELFMLKSLRKFDWASCGARLVGEATNGHMALELIRECRPDVIFTDISMPVMDGFELFRAVKDWFPQTQVVLLTCHTDFHYAKQALKLGFLDYIVKAGVQDSELRDALQKAADCIERIRPELKAQTEKSAFLPSLEVAAGKHGSESRPEIDKAKALIAAQIGSSFTLASIAEEIGYNPRYFGQLFHTVVGQSFNDYVNRMRIEEAAALLRQTPLKVYEVAERVGIPNYRYFVSLFKKWTGISPTDLKRGASGREIG